MSVELKPCPFCGTQPANDHHANPNVWCNDDKCTISGVVFSGGPRHWNERATQPPAVGVDVSAGCIVVEEASCVPHVHLQYGVGLFFKQDAALRTGGGES